MIDYIRVDGNQQAPMKMKKFCTLPNVRQSIYISKISEFIHNCHDTIKLQDENSNKCTLDKPSKLNFQIHSKLYF